MPTMISTDMMAAQVSMTGRLFHTKAMLVPMAVKASVRSVSSIGIAKALMANANAANSTADGAADQQHCPARRGREQHRNDVIETGKRPQAKKQRIQYDRGTHPQQRQQKKQHAGEQNLGRRMPA